VSDGERGEMTLLRDQIVIQVSATSCENVSSAIQRQTRLTGHLMKFVLPFWQLLLTLMNCERQ
jgi:hypothetical protein